MYRGPSRCTRTLPAIQETMTLSATALATSIDIYLTDWEKNHNFSGVVLVAHKDRILFQNGYGYANRATNEHNTSRTVFRIASVTKMFTAVAILQLQEQYKLHVTDTLSQYIPDYSYGNRVTIHQCLSMTSGIPNYTKFVSSEERQAPITLNHLIDRIRQQTLEYEPGTQFSYSNSNYTVLAYIVEKISGMSYAAYLKQHIFAPLKMHNSYVDDGSSKPHQAIGYTLESDTFSAAKPYEMSWPVGAGNIRSTAEDLYLFNHALHSGNLLGSHSWELMRTAVTQTDWTETLWNGTLCGAFYGYGLILTPATQSREATLGHGGGIGAFTAESIRFMPSDVHLIVLSNHDTIESYATTFFAGLEQIIFYD